MESKPEISVPIGFNETQIFTLETPEDIPFFSFTEFKSVCSYFPPFTYNIITNSSIVTMAEPLPFDIQQISTHSYHIRLN